MSILSTEALAQLIKSRRSIFPKQFNDEPIPTETIMELLENANWAPTHKKTEPWRFVVIRGEGKERLGHLMADHYKLTTATEKYKAAKHKKKLHSCQRSQCIIAIVMKRHEELLPEWEEVAATACAVQNLWLSATAHGIGGYWSSPNTIHAEELRAFLALDQAEKCLGFFYLGNYEEALQQGQRTKIADKVRWINT